MQISSYTKYSTGTFDIDNLQQAIQSLQEQLDTQQRVNKPSDDPVAATQILQLNQSSGRNTQFISNSQNVKSQLGMVDTALGNTANLLSSLKSLVVQAGNGSITAQQLQMMQQQVNQNLNELVGYANATDGRGDYLMGGNQISSPPFSYNGTQYVYNGDSGQRQVQITDTRSLPVTLNGAQAYGNSSDPAALLNAMQTFSQLLGQTTKPANYQTQLDAIMSSLDNAQQQILTTQASVGAAEQENNSTLTASQGMSVQYQEAIGNLQSLDLPKAISDFTMAQTALQYSQLTYTKVTQLSLFNYIS
ncbi:MULTISPECIES: flagellar hook-associated protein FlgL [unclassified Paludibacterium]|uniref:flagellar hook-associated protein FlgL n=1 Tax=unclassified Paludibacterium TaxID=2618429 RepID=UPI001C04CE3B|nr:flagellar hook-associated protein FlgL [Paludibacterium sp. B53371]BEV71505.1 flagellar hook-associated protein FlgL [Paludibacterium sp. THUN1379]